MKLIGIHKDNEPNTNFNLGIYVKPVTEYFFNDVKLKKIKDENIFNEKDNYDEEFNNLNNVEMKEMKPIQNFTFNKKNENIIDNNAKKCSNIKDKKKFVYNLIFF